MLKRTVTYTDYNGEERTEDFYFNLSRTELMELQASVPGGLAEYMAAISAAKDIPKMMEFFKSILLKSYGEKSLDGKHFKKTPEIVDNFVDTQAYDEIFQWVMGGENTMSEFLTGIMPKDVADSVRQKLNAGK